MAHVNCDLERIEGAWFCIDHDVYVNDFEPSEE